MRKLSDQVERVHFYENDRNSPEDIVFPSCLTSLAGGIGLDVGRHVTEDGWTQRRLYFDLLAYTGMGFGLLWHRDGCCSCLDLTQVNDSHDETVERGFRGIGCGVRIMENTPETREEIRKMLIDSIDAGRPVIAFGMVEPPESGLVCGYEEDGGVLLGYDAFQNQFPCEKNESGMVVLRNWTKIWKFAFVHGTPTPVDRDAGDFRREVAAHGVKIMEKTESRGYPAGQAAYRAWRDYVSENSLPPEEIRARHRLHHLLVGNLAEARYFTGVYLAESPKESPAARAGELFREIHDRCWKIWGVLGEYGEPEESLSEKFVLPENRARIAEYIDEIARLEQTAVSWLKKAAK